MRLDPAELVAPVWLKFYGKNGTYLGIKFNMAGVLTDSAGIPKEILRGT
jgi:hypothetical protein